MADVLTQVQDCLDQLLIQMYASVRYIDTRHAYSSIPGQADQFEPVADTPAIPAPSTAAHNATGMTQQSAPGTQANNTQGVQQSQAGQTTQEATQVAVGGQQQEEKIPTGFDPIPDPPTLFQTRLVELAQDLVLKEQQIEALIAALPGIGNSQAAQEARLRELQGGLEEVESERDKWAGVREEMAQKLDGWILNGVKRV